jgi:hypothetical protein
MRRLAIELFVAGAVGAALGMIGPFNTYGFGAGPRMAYWISFILLGYAIFRPLIIVSNWLAAQVTLPRWMVRGLALCLASLPMALLVAWVIMGFDIVRALHHPGLFDFYWQVLLIGVLVNWLFDSVFGPPHPGPVVTEPAAKATESSPLQDIAPAPVFAARLPIGFGPLLALKSEDHYVRAYSNTRDVLVLMRLRDAIAEMEEGTGLQVHRSWWVARDGIARQERSGRSHRLVLTNGIDVPVSREGAAALKQIPHPLPAVPVPR